MATQAIISFGKVHSKLFCPPILEVGSKIQASYEQFTPRDIHETPLSKNDYVGIDIEEGEGVDLVLDLCDEKSIQQLGENRFNTIHCHCVLEHVTDIFSLTRNLEKTLKVGGKLFISVPFVWKIHRIPIDMWRFTPQSIDYLFPNIQFLPENCAISTRDKNNIYPIDQAPELHLGSELRKEGFVFSFIIRMLRGLGLDNGFFKNRALMVESNLMMIGEKMSAPAYTFFN